MKTLEQFKAEQMTDWEFATEYEKIRLELENEKTEIDISIELLNFTRIIRKSTESYDES